MQKLLIALFFHFGRNEGPKAEQDEEPGLSFEFHFR